MKRKERWTRFERQDLKLDDLKGIVQRAKAGPLSEADTTALTAAVETLAFLTVELQAKGASIERLRRLIFGARTEKTSDVLDQKTGSDGAAAASADAAGGGAAGGHGVRVRAPAL